MRANQKQQAEAVFPSTEDARATLSDPAETARYIAEIAGGLRTLAVRAKLRFLVYLLDMVAMEALERSGSCGKATQADDSRTR